MGGERTCSPAVEATFKSSREAGSIDVERWMVERLRKMFDTDVVATYEGLVTTECRRTTPGDVCSTCCELCICPPTVDVPPTTTPTGDGGCRNEDEFLADISPALTSRIASCFSLLPTCKTIYSILTSASANPFTNPTQTRATTSSSFTTKYMQL
ncbi:unnamed protein product [Hydatigera taeniaeformis]|uniref:Uncharacterized protein n=1 Tax=Hydatigena taeniaeformis TaxID=6205 RepID=A0A0R3WMZ6_HYDTA|nr:unnamed protein product [Hydatigera taeniaeformis]